MRRDLGGLGVATILLVGVLIASLAALPARGAVDELTGLFGGDLRVGVTESVDLNPFTATNDASWDAIPLVYDSLARIGADLVPIPWAASGWSIVGNTIEVTLRTDLEFHDGSSLGASDVVYSYTEYTSRGMVPTDLAITSFGSQVNLTSATGAGLLFGQGLTLPIVKDGTGVTNAPVGSGPFTPMTTTMPVTLERNADHYWTPFLDSVTFSLHADRTAAATELLRGNLDFIGETLGVDEPSAVIDVDGENKSLLTDATIINNPGLTHLTVGFNLSAGNPVADSDLRQALAKTLNPILYEIIHPATDRSRTLIIDENVPWYNHNVPVYQVLINAFPRSSALLTPSLQILDNAGYLDRDGDGLREMPDGSPLSVNIVGIPVTENARIFTIQDAIRDLFSRMGIDATLEQVPSAGLPARLQSGPFDLFVANLATTLDPGFLWDYYHTSGVLNAFGYSNATLDTALDDANAAADMADRQAEVDWIQWFTLKEAIAVPVLHFDAIEATARGVFDGWVNMPGGLNNFWTYLNLHQPQIGSLSASLDIVPLGATSGSDVTALVRAVDQDQVGLASVSVRLLAGGTEVTSGLTDTTGSASMTFTAPSVSGATEVALTLEATKTGYVGDRVLASMTVRPDIGSLVVTVAADMVSVGPDDTASITVTVRDGAGATVSGASVSLAVSGTGGALASKSGTTGSGGTFATSFTADVGVRTQFQISATASAAGFEDGASSTSVFGEQRVGSVEPRPSPFFDIGAIIAAIVILVVLAAIVWWTRR
ncbi:MAG: ABC transporter substrate-binding protein [Thermoplasmata archaeon]